MGTQVAISQPWRSSTSISSSCLSSSSTLPPLPLYLLLPLLPLLTALQWASTATLVRIRVSVLGLGKSVDSCVLKTQGAMSGPLFLVPPASSMSTASLEFSTIPTPFQETRVAWHINQLFAENVLDQFNVRSI